MSSRTFNKAALAAALLLAACGEQPPAAEGAANRAAPEPSTVEALKNWAKGTPDDPRPLIFCAVGEGVKAARDCRIEVVREKEGRTLILSLPDGGFRRVRVSRDGQVSAADGAVEPRTGGNATTIGIIFGDERYAVPVSLLTDAPAP
jgi:anaerobic selenocysteine-containing dehydrogenase